jgi:carbamoyl-phosphate synthase large subunit
MHKTILVTGGGGAGNELIYRTLATKYEVYFADAKREAISPVIPEKRRLQIPMATEDHFVSAICELCDYHKIDLLLPSVDEELLKMDQVLELSQDLVRDNNRNLDIGMPSVEWATSVMDKYRLTQMLVEANLESPTTRLAGDFVECDFPCLVKPRSGRGSRGVSAIHSEKQLKGYFLSLDIELEDPSNCQYLDKYIIQELLRGEEYTVCVSANKQGELLAIVPVWVHSKKGITISAETSDNPAVIDACKQIHEGLGCPSACYNIQLFQTESGRVVPIEINPRISTTFCLALSAGIDPIENYYRIDPSPNLQAFESGMELERYWTNHLDRKSRFR